MKRFKPEVTKSDVQKMIQAVDKDNDKKINKKEFIDLIIKPGC